MLDIISSSVALFLFGTVCRILVLD